MSLNQKGRHGHKKTDWRRWYKTERNRCAQFLNKDFLYVAEGGATYKRAHHLYET